jgi:predicted enzyme related to lactoylglutathione lyase
MKVVWKWAAALMLGGLNAGAVAQAPEWPPIGEATAAARTAGRWLWADLVSTETSRSAEFYGKVFGWTFRPVAAPDGTAGYLTILADGRPIGGIVPARGRTERGARWIGLASGDPKTFATRAQERGGTVAAVPVVLPGRGEFTALRDPAGAYFAVVRTERGDPSDHVGGNNEWLWFELWTDDPGKASNFYRDVFGYAVGAADGRPGTDAYILSAGGRARAGVMRSPDPALPAAWIPYVRVADLPAAVARAVASGARVVVAPQPHHRSEVAVLVDPLGAPFAMAHWRPR